MTESEKTKIEKETEVLESVSTGPLVFISHDCRDAELAEPFSKLLKSKESDVRIWLDFYSIPAVAPFALPNSRFNFIYGLPFPPLGSIYMRE